jgi:hypothetical protein
MISRQTKFVAPFCQPFYLASASADFGQKQKYSSSCQYLYESRCEAMVVIGDFGSNLARIDYRDRWLALAVQV